MGRFKLVAIYPTMLYTINMTHALLGRKQKPKHVMKRVVSTLARWKKHPRQPLDLGTKLGKKISKMSNGCWVWIGAVFKKPSGNYGQIRLGDKCQRAHRVFYEHLVGKIPKGTELDHICRNTLCVNPTHLQAITHSENMKRRKDSGLPYCRHGHKYTEETTYIRPSNGRRECKVCKKLRHNTN